MQSGRCGRAAWGEDTLSAADYEATVQQVARENETGYLPPLKAKIDRIEQRGSPASRVCHDCPRTSATSPYQ